MRNSWKIESRWSLSEVCSWAADSLQGRRGAVLSGSGGNEPVGGHRSKGERLCQCGCPRSGRQDGSGRGGGKERAGSEEEDSLSNKNPSFQFRRLAKLTSAAKTRPRKTQTAGRRATACTFVAADVPVISGPR